MPRNKCIIQHSSIEIKGKAHHSPTTTQRHPRDCCADFHSRYTLLCCWDRTGEISLYFDVGAMDSDARRRNGFVDANDCLWAGNAPMVEL